MILRPCSLPFCLLCSICLAQPANAGAASASPATKVFDVPAFAESTAVKSMEDAADDAEIWRNPSAPEQSRIFATDKKSGLMVLDLAGKQVEFLPAGRMNNVDLRDGLQVAGADRVLVGASNRTKLGVSFFLLDPATLAVTHDEASFLSTDITDPYGFCFYRSKASSKLFANVIGKDGEFRQYALTPTQSGQIEASLVRTFAFGSIAEGCVADDRTGTLYVGDELRGIWRLGAEPEAGDTRELIAKVDGVDLVADIEGLTLATDGEVGGFLIASIQGNSTFALFSLPDANLVARFRVTANPEKGIDEVTGTDGIALTLGDFGPDLPAGVFVVQDDENTDAPQNFKIVSWADVLARLQLGQ